MGSNEGLFRVDGQVAVISGGGSGLGRMMAHALATNGAQRVYILGRRLEKLQETAQGHANISVIQADVTNKEALKSAADQIAAEVGFINLLVVNSGVLGPSTIGLPRDGSVAQLQEFLWSYSAADLNQTFAVNNTAAFFTAVAFLALLDAGNQKGNLREMQSSVIFTASIAGYSRTLATGVAYMQSKAGVLQLTKSLSTLLAKWSIRVNALVPGIYPSDMSGPLANDPAVVATVPARRTGTEEDMRGTILFMASRAGGYLNGETLITDGGRLGQSPASF